MIEEVTKPVPKRLSERPTIDPTALVSSSTLGRWTEVGPRTKITETEMGDYSYIVNDGEVIFATIGKFANIAAHVRINPGQHPMDRASMHHFQYRSEMYGMGEDDEDFFNWRRDKWVTIGHDVWIGHGVVIQSGVKIGNGSVIGSNAVVTRDVPPYTIMTGIPATPLRPRFSLEIADAMERICWWDWTDAELKERLTDFRTLDARAFCRKYDVK